MSNSCPSCSHANEPDEVVCTSCGLTLPAILIDEAGSTRPEIQVHMVEEKMRLAIANALAKSRGSSPNDTQLDLRHQVAKARELIEQQEDIEMPKPEEASEIPIDAPTLKIGYDAENDLVIPRPQVSGWHARLALVGNRFVLEDLGSTNGTSINGHRITRAWVAPGDEIGLGSYSFRLDAEMTRRLRPDQLHTATQAVEVPDRLIKPIIIGREPDCDIILDAVQISRHHVRLTFTGAGWRVEDLDSANGLYVNDRNNLVKNAIVTADDVLFLGSYRFPVSRLREFIDNADETSRGGLIPLPSQQNIITIGRGIENDVVIDAPQISRHHARIVRSGGDTFLEDLDSANGTFINGKKIRRIRIEPGQTLSFGSYAVKLDLARGAIRRSYQGDILLQAENVRYDVKTGSGTKRILDGISFTVYPTEFMGLLGPSGSGKTTLLMSLIGYLKPTFGRTLLNGDDLTLNYDRYRGAIGYVPQDDIIHNELTVYEALYYTAKLRLPPDTTDEEIERRITTILTDLEIEQTRGVRIGTPERKGISGGQRKRVNLALELLTEPALLCLDEPTSGLASEDALNVMRLLRRLADEGRTILLTVHQPSQRMYRLLDNVLYLADGEEVYYGPAYPDSVLYFHPDVRLNSPEAEAVLADPGSCMAPIMEAKRAGEPMETYAARYRQSRYHEEYVEDRRKNRANVNLTASGARKTPRFSIRQYLTLCRRYLAIKLKDRMGMFILLVQAPIIGILLDMVFLKESGGVIYRLQHAPFALFMLVISAIWFGCSNAAREIVSEQAIYKRERMVNLSIMAYVGSKFTVLGLLCLVQCVVLLSITYPVLDFVGNPLFHLGILWLSAMAGVGFGLLLSALVRTSEAAMAMVPLLLIPQVILGGAIMPVDQMSLPTWVLSQTTVSRWAFEGVLQAEHLADAYEIGAADMPKPIAPGLPAPPPPPNPLDRFVGESETWLAVDYGVLGGMGFLLIFCVAGALRVREDF